MASHSGRWAAAAANVDRPRVQYLLNRTSDLWLALAGKHDTDEDHPALLPEREDPARRPILVTLPEADEIEVLADGPGRSTGTSH